MELFVSDLDGTLLNKDQVISDYSKKELNRLISLSLIHIWIEWEAWDNYSYGYSWT